MDGLRQSSDFQQKNSALSLDEGCYPEIITPPLWEVPCILKDHQGVVYSSAVVHGTVEANGVHTSMCV